MNAKRDYYEILGVARDADAQAIKSAFRGLALKYHPDRSKEPDAEERFKEIAEAYAILSDPAKRADYDARGHVGVEGFTPEDLFGGIDFDEIFGRRGFGFDFGGGGIFDRIFGRRAAPRRGRDTEVEITVPLERIVTGGRETVRVSRPTTCGACRGSGAKAGTAPRRCDECGGGGQKVRSERRGGISFQRVTTCPVCRGTGAVIDEPCPECRGGGTVMREETLSVTVPAGIEDGTALRVAGHGMPGGEPGVPPGDLFVVVRTAHDPRFERRGADLWRVTPLEIPDAVLGTRVRVPTLDGELSVEVPPGTQPDGTLRLRGKGLPRLGGGRGDLFLRIKLSVPTRLSAEQRELYARLRVLKSTRAGGRSTPRQSNRRNG